MGTSPDTLGGNNNGDTLMPLDVREPLKGWKLIVNGMTEPKPRPDGSNQDGFYISSQQNGFLTAIVIDGVTSNDGLGARMKIEEIFRSYADSPMPSRKGSLSEVLASANTTLKEGNNDNPKDEKNKYATAGAVAIRGRKESDGKTTPVLEFDNVGDVRVYIVRTGENKVICLTRDDNIINLGKSDSEAIAFQQRVLALKDYEIQDESLNDYVFNPLRHGVVGSLGARETIPTHNYETFDLKDGDMVLLACDGVTGPLFEEKILSIVRETRVPEMINRKLILTVKNYANLYPEKHPGHVVDDKTVVSILISQNKEEEEVASAAVVKPEIVAGSSVKVYRGEKNGVPAQMIEMKYMVKNSNGEYVVIRDSVVNPGVIESKTVSLVELNKWNSEFVPGLRLQKGDTTYKISLVSEDPDRMATLVSEVDSSATLTVPYIEIMGDKEWKLA